MLTRNQILLFVALVFAFGCAQQVGPTGGPKDTAPPKIVESEPENFSTGFKGNNIIIRFDEFVQLKDLNSKLIISPPLKENPVFRIRGKALEISFEDTLYPNTTYNFQFGDGIVDINESNILDSNRFVFSTGDKLDSLFIYGKVKNAFDLKPEKKVLVMLYREFEDSLPYKSRPIYFAKTTDDGSFRIQYLREGQYKMFALKDGNSNYLYDLPEEAIGYNEAPLSAGDTVESEVMFFKEDQLKQMLVRGYAEHFGKIVFVFAKAAEKVKIVLLNHPTDKSWYVGELTPGKDSLVYWLTHAKDMDTLKLQVWDDKEIMDTVEIILPQKEEKGIKKLKSLQPSFPEKLILSTNVRGGQAFDLFSPLIIEAQNPVAVYTVENIFLVEKKDTIKFTIASADLSKRKYRVEYKWKENTDYTLFIPPAAFTDIYGLPNDSLNISFKTRKTEEYGTIILKIKNEDITPGIQYIVQLMDKSENIIQEKILQRGSELKFEKVLVSSYKLKMIFDRNKNGKWDTGNYLKKIQPEKVIYYSDKVELKPKFDLDIEWKLGKP